MIADPTTDGGSTGVKTPELLKEEFRGNQTPQESYPTWVWILNLWNSADRPALRCPSQLPPSPFPSPYPSSPAPESTGIPSIPPTFGEPG